MASSSIILTSTRGRDYWTTTTTIIFLLNREVREPISHSPRFSKVMVSFKLLGDVAKLERKVKKGMINGLVVDKTFFHDAP